MSKGKCLVTLVFSSMTVIMGYTVRIEDSTSTAVAVAIPIPRIAAVAVSVARISAVVIGVVCLVRVVRGSDLFRLRFVFFFILCLATGSGADRRCRPTTTLRWLWPRRRRHFLLVVWNDRLGFLVDGSQRLEGRDSHPAVAQHRRDQHDAST